MSDIEAVEPGAGAIAPLAVHAPLDEGLMARFAEARNARAGHAHADPGHDPTAAPAAPVPQRVTVIDQTDTLELHHPAPDESPFTSLIEHELHLHLPHDEREA